VDNGKVRGVRLASGKEMYSDIVLSNATPKVTFLDLMDKVEWKLCETKNKISTFSRYSRENSEQQSNRLTIHRR
jgi:hypothetical protein